MNKPEVPCLNCNNRQLGCHDNCIEYDSYRVLQEEYNEKLHISKVSDLEWQAYSRIKYKRCIH